MLTACGQPETGDSRGQPVTALASGSESFSVPRCSDLPDRSESEDTQSYPAITDSSGKKVKAAKKVKAYEISATAVGEAKQKLNHLWLPQTLPDWIKCQDALATWEKDFDALSSGNQTYGSLTVRLYDAESVSNSLRELLYQSSDPAPPVMPPPDGAWEGIDGRQGWYRDTSQGPVGHRISWETHGVYFELAGPLTEDQLIEIGDSVTKVK
jgi:hypothetical protein